MNSFYGQRRTNRLQRIDNVDPSDLIVIYSSVNADYVAIPYTVFKQKIVDEAIKDITVGANASASAAVIQKAQYFAPVATGFEVEVENRSTYLQLTPSDAFALGTIKLPENAIGNIEVTVLSTEAIGLLAINGQGAAVVGAPPSLNANDFFTLRFDAPTNTWRRIG